MHHVQPDLARSPSLTSTTHWEPVGQVVAAQGLVMQRGWPRRSIQHSPPFRQRTPSQLLLQTGLPSCTSQAGGWGEGLAGLRSGMDALQYSEPPHLHNALGADQARGRRARAGRAAGLSKLHGAEVQKHLGQHQARQAGRPEPWRRHERCELLRLRLPDRPSMCCRSGSARRRTRSCTQRCHPRLRTWCPPGRW